MKHLLHKTERGYTFVEMMAVLLILTITTGLVSYKTADVYHEIQLESFFSVFEEDFLYAKQYAITENARMTLYLNAKDSVYFIFRDGDSLPLMKRTYDSGITMDSGLLGPRFVILANGNNQKAGKWFVDYRGVRYQIVFSLGQGRMYVKKL
ncbi:competence type IV pilus minor pilin ComGD [Bacillus marinisedimentorum]|uniref:competence type IV pilus minor pilin ComGD n=1 Tax=Bacillus marinisedimentorum TaxID=1821260 RepID=UPI000872566E|nr:competence type IV pilus minor pilin ComGD [Bacillus marinisedimentorum]